MNRSACRLLVKTDVLGGFAPLIVRIEQFLCQRLRVDCVMELSHYVY